MYLVIHSARLKLALTYTLGIALIMAAFSIALYLVLQWALAGNLEAGGNAGAHLEQLILETELARARLALAGLNMVGWLLSAAISYLVAGRALRPIEASLARQRQFTAHASHELRTPLTIMKGEIDVTLARERPSTEYRHVLSRINDEVDRMNTSVSDLLALAQVEGRDVTADQERMRVQDGIAAVVELLAPRFAKDEIRFEMCIPPELEAVLDWPRVRHLVQNLLDNALRYTPPGGTIGLSAGAHGRDLQLDVWNSGSRIASTDIPHLFMPFYRGMGSNADSGAGLGLALCDWVARAHGGSISVRNQANGVCFTVKLPHVA